MEKAITKLFAITKTNASTTRTIKTTNFCSLITSMLLIYFSLLKQVFSQNIPPDILNKELKLKEFQENENHIYEVNLKRILEDKYKYALDFYFNVYDISFQNYFQMKSLINNTTIDYENVDLEKVYDQSYNCYFGKSSSDSFPGSNFTSKKTLNKKLFEFDFNKSESNNKISIESSIGAVIDNLRKKNNSSDILLDYMEIKVMNFPYQDFNKYDHLLNESNSSDKINQHDNKNNPIMNIKASVHRKFFDDRKINYYDVVLNLYNQYILNDVSSVSDHNISIEESLKVKINSLFREDFFSNLYDASYILINQDIFLNEYASSQPSNTSIDTANSSDLLDLLINKINLVLEEAKVNSKFLLISNATNKHETELNHDIFSLLNINQTNGNKQENTIDYLFEILKNKRYENKILRKIYLNRIIMNYLIKYAYKVNLRNYLTESEITEIIQPFNELLTELNHIDSYIENLKDTDFNESIYSIIKHFKLIDSKLMHIKENYSASRFYLFIMLVISLYAVYVIYMAYKYFRIYYQKKIQ